MGSPAFPPTFFIIGTDRNIGKTVTSMGIISKLLSPALGFHPEDIGYIKPVGQQTSRIRDHSGRMIEVDKDIMLFTELYKLDCADYRAMSPVVWEGGASERFIDAASTGRLAEEREALCSQIRDAYVRVAAGRKVVVSEGTGQPGVGSVAGLSNGDVITLLKDMGVPVITILVVRGGIGSTIDRLFPHLLSLNCMDCHVDGLIINAVRRDKLDKVGEYLNRYYADAFPRLYGCFPQVKPAPAILGLIPEVPELSFPSMRLLTETFFDEQIDLIKFTTLSRSVASPDLLVRGIKVRSLEFGFEAYVEDGDVVIVGINANEAILSLLAENAKRHAQGHQGLTGLILSCSHASGLKIDTISEILASGVQTMVLPNDSADIIQRIAGLSVKIQPYDLAKRAYVDDTYRNHLDFSWIADRLHV